MPPPSRRVCSAVRLLATTLEDQPRPELKLEGMRLAQGLRAYVAAEQRLERLPSRPERLKAYASVSGKVIWLQSVVENLERHEPQADLSQVHAALQARLHALELQRNRLWLKHCFNLRVKTIY